MASSRTWNLRLNLDEFNALLASLYTDGDRAIALQGLALGMNAGPCPEGVPDAFRRAWELGSGMRGEADEFRAAQAERGKSSAAKRLERTGSSQPQKPDGARTNLEPPFEPPFDPGFEPPSEPNHNPQSTIQETTNDNPSPPTPPRGRRAQMVPPSEEEWVAYCVATWPDWHPTCAAESWAHYKAAGWKMKGGLPVVDWRAAAKTGHGNARQWGKLQPQAAPVNGPRRILTGPVYRSAADSALAAQLERRKHAAADRQTPADADPGW